MLVSKNTHETRHGATRNGTVILLVVLVFSTFSFAQWSTEAESSSGSMTSAKLSPDLAETLQQSNTPVRVIVQYTKAPSASRFMADQAAQATGAKPAMSLPLIKSAAYTMSPKAVAALAEDPTVVHIWPDRQLEAMDDLTDAAIGMSTVRNMGLAGWSTGIGVAVIDSGINGSGDDLMNTLTQSRVFYHQDFTGASEKNSKGTLVYDTYGHGTHVAGIIAGDGTDSNRLWTGIAYGVNLIDLRVLDGAGTGSDSQVIAAIQRAIALKSTYNIRIINMSLGRPVYGSYATDPVCQAVEQAWKAGIVVVVAAGNYGRVSVNGSNGYGTVTVPGNDPYVITVGAMKTMNTATRTDDQIASYSSKGPTTYDHVVKPDILAPGNLIKSVTDPYSTLYNLLPTNRIKGSRSSYDYFVLSGTSMATPVVSGAAAVLLQQNPNLTPDQVKARLMKTAYKTFPASSVATDPVTHQTYTSFYDLFTVGAGYLDLAAAVTDTDIAPANVGSALSPTAVYDSSTSKVSLAYGNASIPATSVVWGGSSVVWGASAVWGNNVDSANSVVWGASSAVWASSNMSGFSVVWGAAGSGTTATSVVWGATAELMEAATVPIVGEQ